MDSYIRKYHVCWKDSIYRPEVVYIGGNKNG